MDRFSEQLITRYPGREDYFKKGLIIAAELLIVILLAVITIWFQYTILMLTLLVAAGSVWLTKYLLEGTNIEYEYIVTNDDLDIDKIIGKRKRKRMVTISLRKVKELAPYLNDTDVSADVTVVAHDATGEDLWYILAETENFGMVMVLFNPNEDVRENIIGGLEPILRAKLSKAAE